jgi:hypothetical protein
MYLITTKKREPDYKSGTVIEVDYRDDRPIVHVLSDGEICDAVVVTSTQYLRLVFRDTGGNLQHILAALVFVWGGDNDEDSEYLCAWPSKATIAEITGRSESTVFRALKEAESQGWLVIQKRRFYRSGNLHNHYTFSVPDVSLTVGLFDESPVDNAIDCGSKGDIHDTAGQRDVEVESVRPVAPVTVTGCSRQRD